MQNRNRFSSDFQQILPLTPVVKVLIIVNLIIWFFGNVIAEQYIFQEPKLTLWFGLIPWQLENSFALWQPLTYMFLHATSPFHIIFNMLLLWWLGGELERHWGSKFFAAFYFVCGVSAALLYVLCVIIYAFITTNLAPLYLPVVGASAAIFALMVAYGMIFGERTVYFMLFFPMKAKIFVAILAFIEVVMILNNGLTRGEANIAHIGGLITGFLFLKIYPFFNRGGKGGGGRFSKRKNTNLKLVVNNQEFSEAEKPKYWN